MDRREFLRKASQISFGAFVAPSCLTSLWSGDSPVRPNILLILTDDQHYWSMADQAMSKTRSRLGAGLTFENAFVQTPLCAPSRISIMTGKRVGRAEKPERQEVGHGIPENWNAAKRFLNHGYQRDSLGYWLKNEAGYRTGYIGKWLNGYERIATWEPPGYDEAILTLGERDPIIWNKNGITRKSIHRRRDESALLGNLTQQFIEGASQDADTPWFCFTSLNAPHQPYDPSLAHKGAYANVAFPERENFDAHDPNKPWYVANNPPLTNDEKIYQRNTWRGKMEELMDVDDAIDSMCAGVDFNNTYVFLSSDNGFMFGEHRLRSKSHPYEESIRVPLLVRGPGMRENATTDLLAANMDIAPTILELAGLDPALKGCDGRSLVAPMFDETLPAEDWREALLLEYETDLGEDVGPWKAIRTESEVYIERQGGVQEYYDLASDPFQLTNIASEADAVTLHEMSSQLSEMSGAAGDTLRAAESPTTV